MNDFGDYVERRLRQIQAKHNFDPRDRRVPSDPVSAVAHGRFQELLRLVSRCGLRVSVPFDSSGLKRLPPASPSLPPPVYVYFARKDGTSFWKIGFSRQPRQRVRQVGTGNDGSLFLRYAVQSEDGRALERALKLRFRRCKTRDRNDSFKGEWFDFSASFVRDLVCRLRAGEHPREIALP